MTETIAQALLEFKQFVAALEFDGDDEALAAKLGEVKALWGQAVSALPCMWRLDNKAPTMEVKAKARGLLETLNLVKKVEVERRF